MYPLFILNTAFYFPAQHGDHSSRPVLPTACFLHHLAHIARTCLISLKAFRCLVPAGMELITWKSLRYQWPVISCFCAGRSFCPMTVCSGVQLLLASNVFCLSARQQASGSWLFGYTHKRWQCKLSYLWRKALIRIEKLLTVPGESLGKAEQTSNTLISWDKSSHFVRVSMVHLMVLKASLLLTGCGILWNKLKP